MWLTSDEGRALTAVVIYALVSVLKATILRRAPALAKLGTVLALALGAGAGAWAGGATPTAAAVTVLAAMAGAVVSHEVLSASVTAALPALSRWPAVAGVLRAALAPSAPTVAQLSAERELRGVLSAAIESRPSGPDLGVMVGGALPPRGDEVELPPPSDPPRAA